MSLYTFEPIYQPRVWGGSLLEKEFGRTLPAGQTIGESWELVDRPERISACKGAENPFPDLHAMWTSERVRLFGKRAPATERFLLFIKILDAGENLSVQVHPTAKAAAVSCQTGDTQAEPKTELWYFLRTLPGAKIYAGLRHSITRTEFEKAMGANTVADLIHSLEPQTSDAMFVPSGRLHAIGGGNLILEIQQNSDTTYRLYDWGRNGTDGKPRQLHIKEGLACANLNDVAPQFTQPHGERVLECPYFSVRRAFVFPDEYRAWNPQGQSFQYQFVVQGELSVEGHTFRAGQGFLVTADHPTYQLTPQGEGFEVVTVEFGF